MSEYCRDDFGLVEQADDDFKMWQGLVGPHYTPSVSEDGTLSWSNDGQLPNPEDVSIKGPPGEPGPPGAPGPGVPAGGTTGQILAKASDEDYDGEWIDPPEIDAGQVSYDSTETYSDGTVGKELGTINSALTSLSDTVNDPVHGLAQKAPLIINTASGDIASFSDGADDMPIRKLVANIVPQQDLHGQTSPYPAGGGKNKLGLTAGTFSNNGITAVVDADGIVTVNGTATANAFVRLFRGTLPFTENMILSGCPSGGSLDTYALRLLSNDGNYSDTGAGATVPSTIFSGSVDIEIRVPSGYTCTNVVFKPMLCLATATDPIVFAPYKNICPLSGWQGLSGQRTGNNLLDDSIKSFASGGFVFFNTASDRYHKTATLQAGTYTFSVTYSQAFETAKAHLSVFDVETDTRLAVAYNNTKVSFTLAKITDISLVAQNSGLTTSDILTAQLELGSTASTYEPYTGEPISVSWQDEAGTVYGGTATYNGDGTWTLVATNKHRQYIGATSEQWAYSSWSKTDTYAFYSGDYLRDSKNAAYNYNCIKYCNQVPSTDYIPLRDEDTPQIAITGSGAPYPSIRVPKGVVSAGTASAFNAYLAENPLDIVYELQTPLTYTITTEQLLNTLYGINNIWVDAGSVSVEYPADTKLYIDKRIAELAS